MTRGMGEMKEQSVEKTITKCRWWEKKRNEEKRTATKGGE